MPTEIRRITYPFPLRPDLVVELRVPEDLKQSEARRLAAFIETLALEPSP